jgi:multicomponent Na+:H+ antiporter subunit A
MVAPTPVSAFLHSATMVKLGVYLLARMDPVFSDQTLWVALLAGFGSLTMMVGAVLAMRETDLKRVLAYSTIVSLGTLVMLIGLPGELAAVATITFLIVHALYKACLFMVAGIIDHETGTRDSSALSGMRHDMPVTAAAALLGGLSMAGLPPFIGFAAKELVYETGLETSASLVLVLAGLAANVVMVVVAAIVAIRCFAGDLSPTPKTPHDPGVAMLAGPVVLAVLGLLFGLMPWLVGNSLIVPAASAMAGAPVEYSLYLWHGFTPMLGLSVLTVALGVAVYLRWDTVRRRMAAIHQIDDWGPDRFYDRMMDGLQSFSTWQTELIQSGSLRTYVARTLFIIAFAALVTLFLRGGLAMPSFAASFGPDLVLAILLVVSALAVARARNFVSGIVAAGTVGFTVALLFLFNGAPDLAFTQFSVEALAIVIMLAIVGRMPFRERDSRVRDERLRDIFIAGGVGVTASLVLLAVLAQPFDGRLSDFFREASVPEAHGQQPRQRHPRRFPCTRHARRDHRARARRRCGGGRACRRAACNLGEAPMNSLILQTTSRLILPAALIFSIYVLLRGHNEPGGGFIGGLIAAAGIAVFAIPRGRTALITMLRVWPKTLIGAGILLAIAAGVPSLLLAEPFLTQQWPFAWFPIGTTLVFDIGVYLVVIGSVLTFLSYYLEN